MMTPIFLNPPNAARYFNLHQDHHHHQEDQQQQLLLATSPFCPTIADQGFRMSDQSQPFNDQLEVNSTDSYGSQTQDLFIFKHQKDQEQNDLISPDPNNGSSSLRWMSSKMRMMRKVINSKTDPRDGPRLIIPNNPQLEIINNVIRTCSDCNTTRTPLWRSGPQGPKTLCNACGIRQRKARKAAMEAAAAATNTSSTEASSSTSNKKKSRLTSNSNSNKKQTPCKDQTNELADSDQSNNSSSSKQQLRFEEFAVDLLSKNASFHRMFPQDEEEGALLLMALSYGLIQS